MKQIPNLFTLLNLLFGCLAIVSCMEHGLAIQYTADSSPLVELPERITLASVFIGLAALTDFLDGFIARLFNATSELGKQLDSLSDVVSFGVAPSMILYQFLKISFASEENGIEINSIFLLPAFFIAAAAAYRLAKFNLIEISSSYFIGVPTPAVGLLVAAFPLIFWYSPFQFINSILTNYWILYVFILITCWLMLSNIKFMSLKMHSLGFKENNHVYILIFLSLLSFLILHWIAVPIIFIAYIILSLIFKKRFL